MIRGGVLEISIEGETVQGVVVIEGTEVSVVVVVYEGEIEGEMVRRVVVVMIEGEMA